MKQPSEFVKGMAIGMIRCGRSMREVGRELNVSHVAVMKWWKRWREEGNFKRKEGSGRPRITTDVTDRKLVIAAKRNRFQSIRRLAVSWKSASLVVLVLHIGD